MPPARTERTPTERRRAIMRRRDTAWARYGFTESDRTQWVRNGIPHDQAPLAMICREVNARGVHIRPGDLSSRIGKDLLLDLVLAGTDAGQLETLIAPWRKPRAPDSPLKWRREMITADFSPVMSGDAAAQYAFIDTKHWLLGDLVFDLARWGRQRATIFESRVALFRDAQEYLATGEPSRNLLDFARAFGIPGVGPALRDFADTLPHASKPERVATASHVYIETSERGGVFHVNGIGHEVIRRSEAIDVKTAITTHLPGSSGSVWLSATDTTASHLLQWRIGWGRLQVTYTPIARATEMLWSRIVDLPVGVLATEFDLAAADVSTRLGNNVAANLLASFALYAAEFPEPEVAPVGRQPLLLHADMNQAESIRPSRSVAIVGSDPHWLVQTGDAEIDSNALAKERAATRKLILTRENRDWDQLGFTAQEKALWVRFGIPEHRAHLAAICREVTDVPRFRLAPDKLGTKIGGSQTILQALLDGVTAWRLEQRIANAQHVTLASSDHAWCRDVLNPEATSHEGDRGAIQAGPIAATRLPAMQDALLHWADSSIRPLARQFRLHYEATTYASETTRPGDTLLTYARGFGITGDGIALQQLATTITGPDSSSRDLFAAHVVTSNAGRRFLYHGGGDALQAVTEAVSAKRPTTLDLTRLLSPTGLAWLGDEQVERTLLAWDIHEGKLRVARLPTTQAIAVLAGRRTSSICESVASLPLDGTPVALSVEGAQTAAMLAALMDELDQEPGEVTPTAGTMASGSSARRPQSITILSARRSGGRGPRSEVEIEREYAWTRRGHWRDQWHPSTKTHERIWINDHRVGPEGAPLLDRDRVRVVRRQAQA